jgi:hypothetical protein
MPRFALNVKSGFASGRQAGRVQFAAKDPGEIRGFLFSGASLNRHGRMESEVTLTMARGTVIQSEHLYEIPSSYVTPRNGRNRFPLPYIPHSLPIVFMCCFV